MMDEVEKFSKTHSRQLMAKYVKDMKEYDGKFEQGISMQMVTSASIHGFYRWIDELIQIYLEGDKEGISKVSKSGIPNGAFMAMGMLLNCESALYEALKGFEQRDSELYFKLKEKWGSEMNKNENGIQGKFCTLEE